MIEAFAPDDPDFFLGDPHAAFRRLRREDPLPWHPGSGGAWCVLKHADALAVSRDPQRFTSTRGVQIGLSDANARLPGVPTTILEMVPPEHNQHRKLVIGAFEVAGEPELLHSRLMHGVERLPVRFAR